MQSDYLKRRVETWRKKEAERALADHGKLGKVDLLKDSPDDPRISMHQEGYEELIFVNADHFRLQRYYGRGKQDRIDDVKTWPEALARAKEAMAERTRVLVYMITASGRSAQCIPARWDEFSKLWEQYRASTSRRK